MHIRVIPTNEGRLGIVLRIRTARLESVAITTKQNLENYKIVTVDEKNTIESLTSRYICRLAAIPLAFTN